MNTETRRRFRQAGLLIVPAALAPLLAGCVSDADTRDTPGGAGTMNMTGGGGAAGNGTAGTAGSGDMAGAAGNGTMGGFADDPTYAQGASCGMVPALITDFSPPAPPAATADAGADAGPPAIDAGMAMPANMGAITFGDFFSTFSGGTYAYPGDGTYAVTSDFSDNQWRMTGSLGDYSGFGLYFTPIAAPNGDPAPTACWLDASQYSGISFTIGGTVGMGQQLTMSIGTRSNQISHLWLNAYVPENIATPAANNTGRCLPQSEDPNIRFNNPPCADHTLIVPIPDTPTTFTATWDQFSGGRPESTIDPAEITSIAWIFPNPPGAGTDMPTPYELDIVVDDLTFIE